MRDDDALLTAVIVPVNVTYRMARHLLSRLPVTGGNWWEFGDCFYDTYQESDFLAGGPYNPDGEHALHAVVPLVCDCSIGVDVFDPACREKGVVRKFRLGRSGLKASLVALAGYGDGTHWAEFLNGEAGPEHADIFLQLAAFGRVTHQEPTF